jgi:hypothetical protein
MGFGGAVKPPIVDDFIAFFEELLSPELCAEIVERFEDSGQAEPGRVFHSDRGHEKNVDKLSFDLPIPDRGTWAPIFRQVHEAVSKGIEALLPHHPSLRVYPLASSGYKIQMYPVGRGKFAWHVDALGPLTQARLLALILYLNDVEEGGETAFHYQKREVEPRAGSAIFFPTAWTHMHCGRVPRSGNKYVITSFFQYQMDESEAPAR